MGVRVSFVYEPEEPAPDHEMGISTAEYDRMMDRLLREFGAEEIEFEKADG